MSATSTYRNRSNLRKTWRRFWLSVVLAVALTLAGVAVVAATAQAGSYSDWFPKQVLMKGGTKLQDGDFNYGGWHWYEAGEWKEIYGDYGNGPMPSV
jgi:hypothetical protein